MAQQEAQEIELSGEELLDQDMAAFESEIEEAEYIEEPEDNEEEI